MAKLTELEGFKNFFNSVGILNETEVYDGGWVHHYVPKYLNEEIRFTLWAVGALFCFDNNGRYLGSVVGDEQIYWEGRSNAT